VEREIADTTFGERIKDWAGSVDSSQTRKKRPNPWRDHLRAANWRPE